MRTHASPLARFVMIYADPLGRRTPYTRRRSCFQPCNHQPADTSRCAAWHDDPVLGDRGHREYGTSWSSFASNSSCLVLFPLRRSVCVSVPLARALRVVCLVSRSLCSSLRSPVPAGRSTDGTRTRPTTRRTDGPRTAAGRGARRHRSEWPSAWQQQQQTASEDEWSPTADRRPTDGEVDRGLVRGVDWGGRCVCVVLALV